SARKRGRNGTGTTHHPVCRSWRGNKDDSDYTCGSSIFCSSDFPMAPTRCSTTLPPLNNNNVGMPRTLYRMAVAPLESTSSLPTFNFPAYSPATTSMVGPICLQGPHHSAQKSTRTGTSDRSTSGSNPASVKVNVFCPAISSPDLLEYLTGQRIHPGAGQQLPVERRIAGGGTLPREVFRHPAPHPGAPGILVGKRQGGGPYRG